MKAPSGAFRVYPAEVHAVHQYWCMSASEFLSHPQFNQLPMFVTPAEVATLRSGDFSGHSVAETREQMQREDTRGVGEWDYRHQKAGGARRYLDALKDSIDTNGGISEPLDIELPSKTPTKFSRTKPTLGDGHHRAVIGMETNRLMPARYYAPGS